MKFNDFAYIRPDMEKVTDEFRKQIEDFKNAESAEVQNDILVNINKLRNNFDTMSELTAIRYSINTVDEFYSEEREYFDEITPLYEGLINEFIAELIHSKFRNELEEKWGKQVFRIAEAVLKTFKPEIIEDLQQENKLVSQYSKLKASAKIIFQGEEKNLSQMTPFTTHRDRSIRKSASEYVTKFYEDNEKEFDRIYDELVKVRHKMAKKLGFNNFIELAYARLMRTDYDSKMVEGYRKQILDNIVPLVSQLEKRHQKRLGLEDFKFYDEQLKFLTGNAAPKGDSNWIIENGRKMYSELSKETDEFFGFMIEHELLDLLAKKGKDTGGYCTYISNYQAPFIFSNFNGTSGDIDVLTHEAGHAFQVYQSRNFELPEYRWPTYEACEIHSMSMEFFAWPWMGNFFKEDELKYKFSHLSEAIIFLPYGALVDEFQHCVYENPEATPEERKAMWRKTERKYLPSRDYGDNKFLEKGGFWFRQLHIFTSPFYYIDYTLAQVCALQFWVKMQQNREKAWSEYLTLCKAGGSMSFLELVKLAQLNNPFEEGGVKSIIGPIKNWLDKVEDEKL